MLQRYTEPARQAIVNASQVSTEEIGVEQLLDGLLLVGDGIAVRVLREAGRPEPERTTRPATGQLPFSPAAKDALERANDEADALGHAWVGTEHLLMALSPEHRTRVLQILSGSQNTS